MCSNGFLLAANLIGIVFRQTSTSCRGVAVRAISDGLREGERQEEREREVEVEVEEERQWERQIICEFVINALSMRGALNNNF